MHKLFTCMYGSRLYGTSTLTSDVDIKHIVLPDLDDLLIGRKLENKVKKTNTQKNTRNSADDVDEEFIPVQIFARDFFEGQTYALELAFALEGEHAGQTLHPFECSTLNYPFYAFTKELRTRFLTSNIKAMMGYVVNQASLYSFKGERLNAVKDVHYWLYGADEYYKDNDMTLGSVMTAPIWLQRANAVADKHPKYFRFGEYDIGGGRMRPCAFLLEKCLPFTNTVGHTLDVIEALMKKYGSRAEAASESNVDWKATMHAMRIVDEGLMLLQDHKLVFPFEPGYAAYLLKMKRGELPLDPIRQELSIKLDGLKNLEQVTTLKSSAELREEFEPWLKSWMRIFYGVLK